jgi:predicted O-methyltransferase YrrM
MWYSLFAFIKYFFKSKTKYGVHSPFVFSFITKSIEKALPKSLTDNLNEYRSDLLLNRDVIEVTDYGAGSKIFKSNQREVGKIAKYAGISRAKAKLLQQIVYYFKPKTIIELGTSLGIATAAMQIANPLSKIISIEGCPKTADQAKKNLSKHRLNNIEIIIGEFSKVLPNVLQDNQFDFFYFDGNHQKQATLDYFLICLDAIHNDSIFVFDDIHWSKEMEEAWSLIIKHQKVTVSIDLFHLGLVFFRKEQPKQDFILR